MTLMSIKDKVDKEKFDFDSGQESSVDKITQFYTFVSIENFHPKIFFNRND